MVSEADRDPRHHTRKMQTRRQETMDHLRADIEKVDEPQLKAMFETAAEVLGSLKKAFDDYEKKKRGGVAVARFRLEFGCACAGNYVRVQRL